MALYTLLPACIYFFKPNNVNFRTVCEIRSILSIKTAEQRQKNVSLLLTLNRFNSLIW